MCVSKKIITYIMSTFLIISLGYGQFNSTQKEMGYYNTSNENIPINDISYTLGYKAANNINMQFKHYNIIDISQISAGFSSGILGEKNKFSGNQVLSIMKKFQKNLMGKQIIAVLENKTELLANEINPIIGPEDAKIAVIEFFDYQCQFCQKNVKIMKEILETNPDVKLIFKILPIFSKKWSNSEYIAAAGNAIYILNGEKDYLTYYESINQRYESKKHTLTILKIKDLIEDIGINVERIEELIKEKRIADIISTDMDIAFNKISIQGVPTFIVMPISSANINNVTIISGFASKNQLQAAINNAKEILSSNLQ